MNIDLFNELRAETKSHSLMVEMKALALYSVLCNAKHLPGNIAECGVFKGGSLKLIAKTATDKTVYGLDTFQGLLEPNETEPALTKGRFACSLEAVKKYISDCPNVKLVEGTFPESASNINDIFCFVHLDMDQYEYTLAGLKFFYDKLVPGGILICDDYLHPECPGVAQAFSEFFAKKQETYIPVGARQICFIKR